MFRALETNLRLLSPFMPFITEELYQRLPNVLSKGPSICVREFPTNLSTWKNDEIEQEVELIQKIAKSIRSARSDYNLPNKTKTEGAFLKLIFKLFD